MISSERDDLLDRVNDCIKQYNDIMNEDRSFDEFVEEALLAFADTTICHLHDDLNIERR